MSWPRLIFQQTFRSFRCTPELNNAKVSGLKEWEQTGIEPLTSNLRVISRTTLPIKLAKRFKAIFYHFNCVDFGTDVDNDVDDDDDDVDDVDDDVGRKLRQELNLVEAVCQNLNL